MAVSNSIIRMVEDNLHITYSPDESTLRRITNETENGIQFIRRFCDPNATCEPGTKYAAMLTEYVLRAEAGALETFEQDYARDIRAGRIETEVAGYAEALGYAET